MQIQEIRDYILSHFEKVTISEVDGDIFFMYHTNDMFPFATIVTHDNDYDRFSNLNREGFFRFNIGLEKDVFHSLFEGLTDERGFEAYQNVGIDFTKEDTIMPHPTYGNMCWISVVNPSDTTFEKLKKHIRASYEKIAKTGTNRHS